MWPIQRTVAQPILYGSMDGTFDWPMNRWIPSSYSAVSPGGSEYAYAGPGPGDLTSIHVVDVATGRDRIVANGDSLFPLIFGSSGVYLIQSSAGMSKSGSLFLLDPMSGRLRQLYRSSSKRESWQLVIGNAAYGSDLNPADPNPPGSGEANDELIRLDLATGQVEPVVYIPGHPVAFVGQTADGRPIASLLGGLYIIDAGGSRSLISGVSGRAAPLTDATQTWLLDWDSTSLFRLAGAAAIKVVDLRVQPSLPTSYLVLAGGCG